MSIPGAASPLFLTSAAAAAAAGYQIDRSLRFNDGDSAYLNRTPSSAGNRRTWTWSGWVKRGSTATSVFSLFAAYDSSNTRDVLRFESNKLNLQIGTGGTYRTETTDAVFRDPSAWYHIVAAFDSTQSTAADRLRLYVNGAEQSVTGTPVNQDTESTINNTDAHYIGARSSSGSAELFFDGYLAEVQFVDGQALAASDFGEYDSNSVWQPKEFAGVYVGTTTTATGALPIRNTTGDFGATAASGFRTDANASDLFLALPLNTDTNDVSNSINSNSTTKTTTNQSTATSNSKSQFYGASSYWNNNSDGILVAQSGSELVLGTGDFTIELWFYDDSNHNGGGSGRCYLFDNRIGGSVVGDPPTITGYVDGSSDIKFGTSGGGTITSSQGSNGVNNKWFHFAAVRSSGTTTLYINGTSVGSHTDTTNYPNNGIGIGRATDGGYGWAGYIQDFRVYKTAKYTSNFIPVAQNNSFYLKFADNSSNAALGTDSTDNSNTWTVNNIAAQGSTHASAGTHQNKVGISFNGTNAEINLSADTDVNPGSGVFTLECYAYALSGGNAEFGIYDGSPGGNGSFVLRRVGAGTLMVERHNTAFDITGAAFSENTWHHVAVTRDSSNNVRLFVDGNQSGSTSSNTHNYQGTFRLGRTNNAFTNGYISNLRLIKGTCLYTSNFTAPTGNLTNVTNTKLLMAQSTTSATAATVKPSGVTISGPGDSTIIDSLLDTPTNGNSSDDTGAGGEVSGNYCTFNVLNKTGGITLSNGNLDAACTANSTDTVLGTVAIPRSGKYYFEFTIGSNYYGYVGISNNDKSKLAGRNEDGRKYTEAGHVSTPFTSFTAGDVIGVALNNNTTLTFYKNGVAESTTVTVDSDQDYFPFASFYNATFILNAGQRAFAYSLSNHKTICTTNFSDPTIADGSTAFGTVLYSGDGQTTQTIALPFAPGLLWQKKRSHISAHYLLDAVRGFANDKALASHDTEAEGVNSAYFTFSQSGSNITVGDYGTNTGNEWNTSGRTHVIWTWDAGTSTVSNTDGSITSSVRANQTVGFSIVTATQGSGNSTWGHGLNAKPDWIIMKVREATYGWYVSHSGLANQSTKFLNLHNTNAEQTNANWFASTEPTSSVITSKAGGMWNSGDSFVAYCWTAVEGYSAFGSYEGNGSSADGPFVYTGFRPAFIIIKNIDNYGSGYDWFMFDTARDTYNVAENILKANLNGAETDSDSIDILSNGFKIRTTANGLNLNAHTHIYAAFAEHPQKTARAR